VQKVDSGLVIGGRLGCLDLESIGQFLHFFLGQEDFPQSQL
jgi:hypothetical protein